MVSVEIRREASFTKEVSLLSFGLPFVHICLHLPKKVLIWGSAQAHKCPKQLCASVRWAKSVPQKEAHQERSKQAFPDQQMKEKLQWLEQGSISEPSAFQDWSSKYWLFQYPYPSASDMVPSMSWTSGVFS